MTIIEAINEIDSLKHNTYTQSDKVRWLSRLDAMVKRLIIDTHENADDFAFKGYDEDTDMDTELIVPAPFDEMYIRWLEAQIDYANGEYNKYNTSITMYQTAYDGFANYYNRTHMPLGSKLKYF